MLDCLEVFEEEIELAQQPTIAGLESELVSSSGIEEGLLRNIHEARPWPSHFVHKPCACSTRIGSIWRLQTVSHST